MIVRNPKSQAGIVAAADAQAFDQIRMEGPSEVTHTPSEFIRKLFSPRQFQAGVDDAFRDIFHTENKRADGRAHVIGVCPVNPGVEGFMYTLEGDKERVYRGVVDPAGVEQWFSNIKDRFPRKFVNMTVDSKRVIVPRDHRPDEVMEIIRGESVSAFSHEIQHLSWYALTDRQRAASTSEIKKRLSDFGIRREKIRQSYSSMGDAVPDGELDDLTCNEVMSEARRLTTLRVTDSPLGYFESGAKGFVELAHVMPVMDAITKNYAQAMDIKSPEDAFSTLDSQRKVWGLAGHDRARTLTVFKLPEVDPFELPRAIRLIK